MDIYEQLKAADQELSNWCSDLYVRVNEDTTVIINQYEFKQNVTTFISPTDLNKYYEIPFAYDYKKLGDLK